MNPDHRIRVLSALLFVFLLGLFAIACTTAPAVAPSAVQIQIANAVEDALSVGLVPVLTKNQSYLPAAQGLAAALGTFSGDTLTPADVDAVLAKANIAPQDAAVVAGIVNAAWATYQRRYAQQVSATMRPDVKLFLNAVVVGIQNAIAAIPRPLYMLAPTPLPNAP